MNPYKRHKSFRRKIRNWIKDARYRQQRRYVTVGIMVCISGFLVAGGISVYSSNFWILIIVTFLILIAWSFVRFFDDV